MKSYCRLMLSAVALLGATAVGCGHKPINDEELERNFLASESLFVQLSSAYSQREIQCVDSQHPDSCLLRDQRSILEALGRKAHVRSAYVKKNRTKDNGLWLPVQTYGILSTSSSTRGYVYLQHPTKVTVSNTLDIDTKGASYRPLTDGWYIFIVN